MVCRVLTRGKHPSASPPLLFGAQHGFTALRSRSASRLGGGRSFGGVTVPTLPSCSSSNGRGCVRAKHRATTCLSGCSRPRSSSAAVLSEPRDRLSAATPSLKGATLHTHIPDSLGWPAKTFSFIPQRILGKGSSGHVFLAYDPLRQEAVAVKAVKKETGAGDLTTKAELFSAIQQEVDFMAMLQGPQVAELKAVYEDSLFAYITMEVCDSSLQEFIDCHVGPIPEPVVASFARQMIQTIEHVHANGICYSDVKPANFLLKASAVPGHHGAEVKLSDFGCSQDLSGDDFLTRRTGTPLYTAPEVFLGRYGLEADMWGIGVIVYRMLCGVYPFRSNLDQVKPSAMMMSILHDEVSFSGSVSKSISNEAKDLIRGMLTRCASKRITAGAALQHPWLAQQEANHCHFVPFQHYEATDDVVERNIEHFRQTSRAVGTIGANSESTRTAAYSV